MSAANQIPISRFPVPELDTLPDDIKERLEDIVAAWKTKYPKLVFNTATLRFDNLVNFNDSFTKEIALLNFDA